MSKKNRERRQQNAKKEKTDALPFTLVNHPARQKPWLTVMIVVFLAFMVWTLFTGFKGALFIPLILMAIVLHGLIPYFFATKLTFSQEGIEIARIGKPTVIKWEDYRSYSLQSNGIVLWMDMRPADAKSSFSEHLRSMRRSMFLPLPADLRERAEAVLVKKLVKVT